MKSPKPKRMRNNASSAVKEKEIRHLINRSRENSNDSKLLLAKHIQLRQSYLRSNSSALDSQEAQHQNPSNAPKIYSRQFAFNKETERVLAKSNFPKRFPNKIEDDNSVLDDAIEEKPEVLLPVATKESKMTKLFVNFWNRFVAKQNAVSYSVLDHKLSESEAGYLPCQLTSLFNLPESYLKKEYCQKTRFHETGFQFLPPSNYFFKISSRSMAKLEVDSLLEYYSNSMNHYYLIPIELSSNFSRCLTGSIEICQQSRASNKIHFICRNQTNNCEETHPISTIEYKPSIDLEVLPSAGLSLVNNFPRTVESEGKFKQEALQNAIFNYPLLAPFLQRNDVWVDDFFARCWHFSRYYVDKLDLGGRVTTVSEILVKDSLFKFLVACSAGICAAVKLWILNPDGATYFRCWCGQKLYDSKQESKMLHKFKIGTADLYNFQQRIKISDKFHNKHGVRKYTSHICACNQQFGDHKLWLNHIFSTKIFDISKICPVFMYNFAQQSSRCNRYICECDVSFSDYDFWTFWLHACNCNVLKNSVKFNCRCNTNNKVHKISGVTKILRRSRMPKRGRLIKNNRSRSRQSGDFAVREPARDEREVVNQSFSSYENKGDNFDKLKPLAMESKDVSDEIDNVGLPLKMKKNI